MTQKFASDGTRIPVTAIEAGPCKVVQVRTSDKDGYAAVQIGFGKKRKLNKASSGHQKGNSFAYLREFKVSTDEKFEQGQEITVSSFTPGQSVKVSGIMKGRGFAGVMKRHGFKGFPASHGHDQQRRPGSIGSRFPQHTLKGTRMAGRMGGQQVTVSNLLVIDVDPKANLVWVKGAIPGATGGLVKVVSAGTNAEEIKLNEFKSPQITEEQKNLATAKPQTVKEKDHKSTKKEGA